MKTAIFSLLLLFHFKSEAQTITPQQAKDSIGKIVTVCGEVIGSYVAPKSGTVFLNFGADYPNQIFVVFIYDEVAKTFPTSPATAFKGKNICVKGEVKMYEGKPEIQVLKPEQIDLTDASK